MLTEEQLKELSHEELLAVFQSASYGSLLSSRVTSEMIRRNACIKEKQKEVIAVNITQYLLFLELKTLTIDNDCVNIFELRRKYHGSFPNILEALSYVENFKWEHDIAAVIYELSDRSFEMVKHGFYSDNEWTWYEF